MKSLLVVFLTLLAGAAWASDACSTRAVVTSADVAVSDGTSFRTESFFHSKESAAIRHLREEQQNIVVEGPLAWANVGDKSQLGENFYKLFALGHQYHAFLLHFDEIVTDPRETGELVFRGRNYRARSGEYPYGGTVHLVEGEESKRPEGLQFEFPDSPTIEVTFSDWRELDGIELPYRAEIDDGERVFDYRYTNIEIEPGSPLWFFESVSAPSIDEVQIYRLHRKMLAAHCLGDADLMSQLSAENVVSANRGRLQQTPNESLRERFTALFERIDYSGYHDIETPIISVAESSDIGWIGANVRAVGSDQETGQAFDTQWAWFMTVQKVDGRWLHSGNASNMMPTAE